MNFEHFCLFLKQIGQQHLLEEINTFSEIEKKQWFQQIGAMGLERGFFAKKKEEEPNTDPPLDFCEEEISEEIAKKGEKLIRKGEVCALILSGGQGTRLGFKGPKGCFPIFGEKSLFEWHMDQIKKKEEIYNCKLPVVFMTSPLNHSQTLSFFKEKNHFGFDPGQIDFFCQKTLPILNEERKWFWSQRGRLAESPNGNGDALKLFCKWGLDRKTKASIVSQIFIDNPLADPFDLKRIGFHACNNADATVQCIRRDEPHEKLGMLVQRKNGVGIIEYTDVPLETQHRYPYANTGQIVFSMNFVKKIFQGQVQLPLHPVRKKAHEGSILKYEKFLFDTFEYANKVQALCSKRNNCYAPLKEKGDFQKIFEYLSL